MGHTKVKACKSLEFTQNFQIVENYHKGIYHKHSKHDCLIGYKRLMFFNTVVNLNFSLFSYHFISVQNNNIHN